MLFPSRLRLAQVVLFVNPCNVSLQGTFWGGARAMGDALSVSSAQGFLKQARKGGNEKAGPCVCSTSFAAG